MNKVLYLIITLFIFFPNSDCIAQEDNWDNILYVSNKFSYGGEYWKHSFEFQTRYNNDATSLEQYHVEYITSYLIAKKWELTPDLRYTRKPDQRELRPGFGVIRKLLFKKSQLVHQIKYQYDMKEAVTDSHGLRYAMFYNYVPSEKFIYSAFAGGLFELGEDWSGFLGFRGGVNAAYVINKAHSINVGYFYGLINDKTNNYSNIGVISLQLIININKNYKYLPAKYYSL